MRSIVAVLCLTVLCGCAEQAPAVAGKQATTVPMPPPKPGTRPRSTGALCGDPRLVGSTAVSLKRPIAACGIPDPVRLTKIAGVELTTPAVLDCHTAKTFADWITQDAEPAARKILGGNIQKIWMMGAYSCRSRNSQKGARLSEHAFGRAVDVGGVWLSTGKRITVQQNWGKGSAGQFLRRIWKAACGPFKTVLGPDGDRFHQDHLHFDTARRRSTFCR